MHTYTPSVRGAISVLLLASLFSFRFAPADLQGKWECDTKSGNLDASTSYQIQCDGYLLFRDDNTLESTCLDGFFPNGTQWEISGQRLILKDSDGHAFADFEIRKLDNNELCLFRKNITYLFRKTG
ncbi:MAG: lipocalin family protein [Saprospiraceae bacterium]|nr:lipocalin family protein [Saprospiraceae bacterium]MCB0542310.1 lipocalin family protein [Saprospiraceae bacterium]MCB0573855.1 lipocalin family protein [Saprospiraceae bacterium]MCB9308213.1 lipocalin family protein [Lewinellaceae bacterium]